MKLITSELLLFVTTLFVQPYLTLIPAPQQRYSNNFFVCIFSMIKAATFIVKSRYPLTTSANTISFLRFIANKAICLMLKSFFINNSHQKLTVIVQTFKKLINCSKSLTPSQKLYSSFLMPWRWGTWSLSALEVSLTHFGIHYTRRWAKLHVVVLNKLSA